MSTSYGPIPGSGSGGGGGDASAANQVAGNASLASIDSKLTALSQGRSSIALARNDYTSTPVSTSAYTEIVSSLSAAVSELYIFDSSGRTLFLAVGAAGSEVNKIYIVPGGNGLIDLAIPLGSRVSIKAIGSAATAGEISITFLG